ncbi:MAG: 3D domain-containing protein [Sorangiineae bacterium]|nr:3D domain-containing protein [Polyangiaceae bacterium]MEB2324210.1 3D domain-containing protein [Sorangiineae bacterium]
MVRSRTHTAPPGPLARPSVVGRPPDHRREVGFRVALALALGVSACATAGSAWMEQPLPGADPDDEPGSTSVLGPAPKRAAGPMRVERRVIGGEARDDEGNGEGDEAPAAGAPGRGARGPIEGKVLGSFRNTYYDFPSERDFEGEKVALKDAKCKTIEEVPRGFFEAVCVQGSGTLARGATVSFAKRDCECAEVCPRTSQKICFDELDPARFPWGRGAAGVPITPLLTVAMDTSVTPLGTAIYIPEYDGVPRDRGGKSYHDGCFIVQDRGLKVEGKHVDIFTGEPAITRFWNGIVPSNQGVTVVLDSPRCARATLEPSAVERARQR